MPTHTNLPDPRVLISDAAAPGMFTYNLVAIPLAIAGLLSPIAAVAVMALSSLAVLTDSPRLRTRG